MSRPLRVAFVSHSARLYGASRSLIALLEGLRENGVETCTILPQVGPMQRVLDERGLAAAIVPFPCWVSGAEEECDACRGAESAAVREITAALKRIRPDVVWSNSSVTPVGSLAAAVLGIPHVWHLRETNGGGSPFRFVAGTESAIELIRGAQARIAISAAVREHYEAIGSGPCAVIYNGIASARELERRPAARRAREPPRILMAARIQREKGQLRAIEAARLLIASGRDVDLRIVGDGDAGPCREAIERAGLGSAVTLAGFVSNLDGEYLDSHLALSCSRIEAMGRMTAEAMSFALPVVGCDSLGTAEIVEHGVTGLLCDGSAAEIARAVERLIERPDEARRIGLQAQEFARRTFSDETCTRAALEVLRRVCGGSVSTAPYLGAAPQLAGASER